MPGKGAGRYTYHDLDAKRLSPNAQERYQVALAMTQAEYAGLIKRRAAPPAPRPPPPAPAPPAAHHHHLAHHAGARARRVSPAGARAGPRRQGGAAPEGVRVPGANGGEGPHVWPMAGPRA